MESDLGKLFIGGISWDTDEEHLKDYFKSFGDVVEAVIMKDRNTGRARGFGFVVFADPAVAERVVMEKHTIDGRVVEAKKAVPRDDQYMLNRNSGSVHGSPSPARTKKIFVGGLASTVTETEFKKYFDQFGTITDVVVMYDHNTQRPRGFGFITFDSEDAVDKVLLNTFHELNGKMVEVKRAVPKELSPSPTMRSPIGGYNYGINRFSNILNGYAPGYNLTSVGNYGMRMDGRFGPVSSGRSNFTPFGSIGYGMGMNYDPSLSPSYGGNMSYNSSIGYVRGLSPYINGNSSRFGSPVGYNGGNGGTGSLFSSNIRNLWGNGGHSYNTSSLNSNAFLGGSGSGTLGGIPNSGINWSGSSSISAQDGGGGAGYSTRNLSYGSGENSYGLDNGSYGRNTGSGGTTLPYIPKSGSCEGAYADLYEGSSVYGDPTWRSASSELDGSGPFVYGLDSLAAVNPDRGSTGYSKSYDVNNSQPNRGIAA